jgi:peptidoglycan hydrolase-like protein with peptidoglycan-binding domain
MQQANHISRHTARAAALAMTVLLLASCAESGFQWPWSGNPEPKPETKTEAPPAPLPTTKGDVRKIQAGLAKLGYRPGPADGKPGRKTKRAIKKYQRKNSLLDDGETSLALLAHIEISLEEKSRRKPRVVRVPLPSYSRGTDFVYKNGEVDRVESVKRGVVKWRRSDGVYVMASRNFLLPRKYWETKTKRGKAVLTSGDKSIWPNQKNEKKSFVTVKTVIDRADESDMQSVEESWSCVNEGRNRLTVAAGVFDTVRFVCTRAESDEHKSARRVWHYAPEIGHYVRLDEFSRDQPTARRRELVAIRPGALKWPPVARAALEQRLIAALNKTPVGGSAKWDSSGISTDVTVEMVSEYFDPQGRQCRRYLQIWTRNSRERRFPGVACRNKAGNWQLPVATAAIHSTLAVATRPGS